MVGASGGSSAAGGGGGRRVGESQFSKSILKPNHGHVSHYLHHATSKYLPLMCLLMKP